LFSVLCDVFVYVKDGDGVDSDTAQSFPGLTRRARFWEGVYVHERDTPIHSARIRGRLMIDDPCSRRQSKGLGEGECAGEGWSVGQRDST
jgi:hypothetical protein